MRGVGWARSVRVGVAAAIAGVVALAAPSAAGADGGGDRDVKVMTQNLYLGSSLAPALPPNNFIAGVAQIYQTVQDTDFPTRAKAITDTVAAKRPDLIGLQEVSNWQARRSDGTELTSYDFLEILQLELKARGLNYTAERTSNNANITAPLLDAEQGCTVVGACFLTFQDRDVILANDDTPRLDVTNGANGNYVNQATVPVPFPPGSTTLLDFNRGWAYIDGTFHGARFRFVTTHLEVDTPPLDTVQEAQARELVAGPLKTLRPVILVGDLNSAADGSTTDSYFTILKAFFADAWWTNLRKPGFTCCQDELLNNPVSKLSSRIDYVLTRLALPTSAHLVNQEPLSTPLPHWASDHAGVSATVRLF
jgi:endonuclease/exonuclease/phosphatase family metal-dependent hydrolase